MVNDNPVFQDSLLQDPGKIAGIKYKFHGTGIVENLTIKAPDAVAFEFMPEQSL